MLITWCWCWRYRSDTLSSSHRTPPSSLGFPSLHTIIICRYYVALHTRNATITFSVIHCWYTIPSRVLGRDSVSFYCRSTPSATNADLLMIPSNHTLIKRTGLSGSWYICVLSWGSVTWACLDSHPNRTWLGSLPSMRLQMPWHLVALSWRGDEWAIRYIMNNKFSIHDVSLFSSDADVMMSPLPY